MSGKYYAVANGHQTGIFRSWNEVRPLVNGYHGAKYKSFKTLPEAQNYISGIIPDKVHNPIYDDSPDKKVTTNIFGKKHETKSIISYTDGSCVDKVGGFGYVIIKNNYVMPLYGKVPSYPTTNQVAELYAIYSMIYHVLEVYKDEFITNGLVIYTDSKYCIGCITTWYHKWLRNGWKNSKGEPVANKELIHSIIKLSVGLNITYHHVKAHNGDTYNEWADRLANDGRLIE